MKIDLKSLLPLADKWLETATHELLKEALQIILLLISKIETKIKELEDKK